MSLTEEAEAINWYEQRISVEKNRDRAKKIMQNAQQEEFKHFGMDLEYCSARNRNGATALKGILFQSWGDIVPLADEAEENAD